MPNRPAKIERDEHRPHNPESHGSGGSSLFGILILIACAIVGLYSLLEKL
jgi:hypothetical protein